MEIVQEITNIILLSLFTYSILTILKYVWFSYMAIISTNNNPNEKIDLLSIIKIDLPISISYFIGYLFS